MKRRICVGKGVICLALLCISLTTVGARNLQQADKEDAGDGGFLSEALPLKVVVTTPSALAAANGTLRVQNKQALTVVFSRSVIALGEDFGISVLPEDKVPFTLNPKVPGKFRWVTTYIARWDPEESWPLDSNINFIWNKGLKTHDGIVVSIDEATKPVQLTTPGLSMRIQTVTSEKSERLTDGHWDPYRGSPSDILPEVPPDGAIQLGFNHNVSISVLNKKLKVLDGEMKLRKRLKVFVEPCVEKLFPIIICPKCPRAQTSEVSPTSSTCANVTISGSLKDATTYYLSLPKGVKYSDEAGALQTVLRVKFGGLRKFQIPMLESRLSTPFVTMLLPHGLDESIPSTTSIANLKEQFTLTLSKGGQMEFELSLVDKGTILMIAPLQPKRDYKLEVAASSTVLDGFGQPLLASNATLAASAIDDSFSAVHSNYRISMFESGQDWGRKLFSMSKGDISRTSRAQRCSILPGQVNAFKASDNRMYRALMAILEQSSTRSSLVGTLGEPAGQLNHGNNIAADLQEIDISPLLKPTGIIAYEYCSYWSTEHRLLVESDIQAIVLGSQLHETVVWLTSMKTGKPVRGAKVSFYRNTVGGYQERLRRPEDFEFLKIEKTDAEGKATFLELGDSLHMLVQHKKKVMLVANVDDGYLFLDDRPTTKIVLDRKLVKPGDSVHLKGYHMQPSEDGVSWTPANLTGSYMEVLPLLDPESESSSRFDIETNNEFGSYETQIPIPDNAKFQDYSIFLSGGEKNSRLYQAVFTVGDPRPPTVGLTVDAPFWAKPDSTIKLAVFAESFIGSAVGNAEMTMKWRVSGNTNQDEELKGESAITTDETGKAETSVDLSTNALDAPSPSAGSTLIIEIEWIGPTRELIEETASVRLELADIKVSLDKTVDTDIPKQGFGVKAVATDLKNQPIEPRELVIELKELPEDDDEAQLYPSSTGVEPLEGNSVDSCTTMSGSEDYNCRFSLPSVGRFALEVCVDVDSGAICTRNFIGKSAKQWDESRPLRSHFPLGFIELTSGPYNIGDTAIYLIDSPYENAKAIMMWGSTLGSQHKIIALQDKGITEVPIPVDENCIANCRVTFGVSIPRQTGGLALETELPVSKLFDLAMPHTEEDNKAIDVEQDNTLDVAMTFPDSTPVNDEFVVPPGDTAEIEVQLEDNLGEAEILVVAVDKSILELIPYPLQNVAGEFLLDLAQNYGFTSSSRHLIAPQAASTLLAHFTARSKLNPWFNPATSWDSSYDVDLSEEEYIENESESIRSLYGSPGFRFRGSPARASSRASSSTSVSGGVAESSVSASGQASFDGDNFLTSKLSADDSAEALFDSPGGPPLASAVSNGGTGNQESASVRLQKDFVSTALFQTVVSEKGVARVNFTAPDNLGTFIVRAYAASGTGLFGEIEKELVVRRKVSLTPSAPRFARVGDVFEAGAVLTVSGSTKKKPKVTVTLELEGESGERLTILGSSKQVIKVGRDGTEEVRFQVEATKVGAAAFKISADAGSGATDALVIDVPVEGLQEAVAVASSFAVDGNATGKWQEGLKLPEAVPGSGALKIQAGVGRMPTILSLTGQLYDQNPEHDCPIRAEFALALASIPFITKPYDVLNLDTNTLDEGTIQVLVGILPNFTAGLASLMEMTSNELGLEYTLYCPQHSFGFRPTKPSLYQNARGVWVLNELSNELGGTPLEGIERGADSLASLKTRWIAALERALLFQAKESRNKFFRAIGASSVAIARAALGGNWNPPGDTPDDIVQDLSMGRLSKEFDTLGVESQAYYVLTRMRMRRRKRHPDIKKAINSWTTNFRVGGRTAYVASGKGSPSPASNVANSLILMAMTRGKVNNALVEKLANYIGSPPVGPYGFRSFGNYDKTVSMISLREYDVAKGNDQPNVELKVRSGSIDILNFLFKDNSKPVTSSTTLWEDLDSPPKPLEFEAEGTGEVTLAASLTFVPAKLLPFPTYRGIFVQRSIRLADSNGPSLKTIPVTSVVDISVQLMTPDRLGPSTVRVLMPAGLEPVDPNVSPSDDFCPLPFRNYFSSLRFFSCPDQETRPSVVIFSFRSMTAGTHEVSFRAVAATAGTFSLPPVRAFVDEQPELMGMSSAGELLICSGPDCEAVADTPPKPPKTCPKNCSDNGGCDLDSGTCLCLPGFTGEDCASIESS